MGTPNKTQFFAYLHVLGEAALDTGKLLKITQV
jgi:hypothetical protein